MAATPLVSVVTPVWNAAATLRATVASVRAQTLPDWELTLVDDASTDGSREIARALAAEDARIRLLVRERNGGAAAARNDAIRAARGRLVAFLDADDRWYPEKLARQAEFMAGHGHALVFSAYRRVDAAGRPLGVVRPPPRVSREQLLRGNVIGCLTAVYDSAVFGRAEMPEIRRRAAVRRPLDQPDARVAGGEPPGELARAVGRGVVDEEELPVGKALHPDRGDGGGERRRGVPDRGDDREERRHQRARKCSWISWPAPPCPSLPQTRSSSVV